MFSEQGTEVDEGLVTPAAIPGASDSEQIRIGEQVAEMLQHPGFQALAHFLHLHGESILRTRMLRKHDSDSAAYADVMGHLRGLREVVPAAHGLVLNGKEVAERRNREGVS